MYFGLHVKYPVLLSDFTEIWIFWTDFRKSSNIKFHENPSSWSRVVPCGRTDRRTDMTKPIVAFRNFANAPKTCLCVKRRLICQSGNNWTGSGETGAKQKRIINSLTTVA